MAAPPKFIINLPLKHRSPESVRELVHSFGFELQTDEGTSASEIWSKPDGKGGYWIIRLDSMGHGKGKVFPPKALKPEEKPKPNYFFSERPHYHKNWIASQQLLEQYCKRYTPEAWIYADSGELLCQAGDDTAMHPDRKAKLQHILR
jgi:hypothetical protein